MNNLLLAFMCTYIIFRFVLDFLVIKKQDKFISNLTQDILNAPTDTEALNKYIKQMQNQLK